MKMVPIKKMGSGGCIPFSVIKFSSRLSCNIISPHLFFFSILVTIGRPCSNSLKRSHEAIFWYWSLQVARFLILVTIGRILFVSCLSVLPTSELDSRKVFTGSCRWLWTVLIFICNLFFFVSFSCLAETTIGTQSWSTNSLHQSEPSLFDSIPRDIAATLQCELSFTGVTTVEVISLNGCPLQ